MNQRDLDRLDLLLARLKQEIKIEVDGKSEPIIATLKLDDSENMVDLIVLMNKAKSGQGEVSGKKEYDCKNCKIKVKLDLDLKKWVHVGESLDCSDPSPIGFKSFFDNLDAVELNKLLSALSKLWQAGDPEIAAKLNEKTQRALILGNLGAFFEGFTELLSRAFSSLKEGDQKKVLAETAAK